MKLAKKSTPSHDADLCGDVGHLGLERDERDPVADVADAARGEEQRNWR